MVPDLPEVESEEFSEYKQSADDHGLSTILLAAPTTTEKKLKILLQETSGFLYLVSLTGVTGARKSVAQVNLDFIRQVCRKAEGSARVAVGFGILQTCSRSNDSSNGCGWSDRGKCFRQYCGKQSERHWFGGMELFRLTRSLRNATAV